MEALRTVTGVAAPLLRINIDTDQIIPTLFLGGTDAKGYGAHLFHGWRFLADGSPNPEFVLNQPPYDQAQVLLADRNFGCGSSRERAPKALREFGFRAIIAPSFGGIFFNNCFRNGIVPVELPIENVRHLASLGGAQVTVDLEQQVVIAADGSRFAFKSPETLRQMLLAGVDEIQLTLERGAELGAFRDRDRAKRPWAY
ncbi:3-isopropylmalate dehydratase small subunit [Ramlibacter albus]|uniref:3-isopropylmalate dehydratase small subunit n=1 Tax=Ramlibacter albus TaxID=2079448 RepID=A0A923S1L5_9BURK|nr:3-isopropylmalate dehydratase small subunit [Ramlibacter albus]MBC5764554.1 3-isopropylmalate dehydratase small subunit [Ramlibacter albus]